jgi:hypothetical protein
MNKRNHIIIVAVIGLATVVLSVFFYLDSKPSNNPENKETATEEQVVVDGNQQKVEALQRLEAPPEGFKPEGFDPSILETTQIEESFAYNDQIISPNTVASKPDDFLDKEISVRGWIVEPSEGLFIVTSINIDEQKGLILSKNESIDFREYTNNSSDYTKTSKPVTLTGTFSINEASGTAEYTVRLLDQ